MIILLYYNDIILCHYIILLLNALLFYTIYTIYPLAKVADFCMEIYITSTH